MKKTTVTIGIPAYYAEKNIKNLLKSLILQVEENFRLEKIIVYYDVSGDATLQRAREVKDKRINLIDGKVRKGFANGVKKLIDLNNSDIVVLLNDDIKITDKNFLKKIVKPFLDEKNIGLVCGNPQTLKPITFIDKALASRLKASEKLSYQINSGSNIFSCDGKILAFSKAFIKKLKLPENNKELGNVDAFMYFACITAKFKYRFVKDAIVYYRNPTTFSDYKKWIGRNNTQKSLLQKTFGKELVTKEYTKPKGLLLYTTLVEFLKNPFGCLFVIIAEIAIIKARKQPENVSETWDIVKTTKNLST